MTQNSSGIPIPMPIAQGGTNATTESVALSNLGALPIAGGTMTGNLILNGDPVVNFGAATKQYVDAVAAGLTPKQACVVSTTANLSATYNNGAFGVGATLTNNAAQAAFTSDGQTPNVGDRILVQFQTAQEENGIYELTDAGSGATDWVLTRTTDFDQATEMLAGSWTIVTTGTLYAVTSWVLSQNVVTVGTDPVVFVQFTAGVGANTSLSNLSSVAINTSLISDTDVTDNLGSQSIRWNNIYSATLQTGDTAADTLKIGAWDVDGGALETFITLTADNTPTCVIASGVTGTTQAPSDNSTKLATTAYADASSSAIGALKANVALDNLAGVAINTSLVSDTDVTDNLGSQSIRWNNIYTQTVQTGDTSGDTLTLGGWNGASLTPFLTITAGVTPTGVLGSTTTATTQAPGTNNTTLATTAFVNAATGGGSGANTALSNLAAVAVNTSLISDTDITDDLGSQAIRWNNIYSATLQTGGTAADTLKIGAWDVDGGSLSTFITLTANNTPTCALASEVTGVTQATNDNSTKLATTAYADAAAAARANVALSNLSGVAINASLLPGADNSITVGDATHRYSEAYPITLRTGTSNTNSMTLQGRNTGAGTWADFITVTAGATATCAIASAVTGVTQSASDNSTKLATTAYADNQVSTIAANKALSNLASVAINTSLISDTDVTDNLGSSAIRWDNVYAQSLRTGDTAADVLTISARDIDGAAWIPFITLTANNTPTCALSGDVTGVTQSASDNSTKLATTAYVDAAVVGGGSGSWILLGTATASSSATIDFTSSIDGTYDTYAVAFETVQPATNGVEFWSRMRSGGSFRSTAGDYTWAVGWYTTTASGQNSSSDTEITLVASGRPLSNTNTKGVSGLWYFTDPDSTTTHKRMYGTHTSWDSSSGIIVSAFGGGWLIGVTTAVDGIRFLMSSGNISVGTFQLYGIKKT